MARQKSIVLIVLLIFFSLVSSSAENLKKWYNLLSSQDGRDAVIQTWITTYEFKRDKFDSIPKVIKTDVCRMIPLQNSLLHRTYFTNSHTQIKKHRVKTSEWSSKGKPVIGDCNVPQVFQSDCKFYRFTEEVYPSEEYVEFRLVMEIDDIRFCTREFFADQNCFVGERRIELVIPDWLHLKLKEFNLSGSSYRVSRDTSEKQGQKIVYQLDNVSTVSKEIYSPGSLYEIPHLLFLPQEYQDEQKNWKDILPTTSDLYTWYKKMLGTLTYDELLIKEKLTEILVDSRNRKDSIRDVFYWVQENIRYIAFEKGIDGFRPKAADLVLKNRYGDCKGMANLLRAMYQCMGMDARLAWLGTKKIPYSYQYPSIAVDNHMICVLYDQNQKYFLDATEQFVKIGDCAERIQGREILVENGDSFQLDRVPISGIEKTKEDYLLDVELKNGNLEGKLKMELQGEDHRSFVQLLRSQRITDHEKILKLILSEQTKSKIDLSQVFPLHFDRDSTFQLSMNLSQKNACLSFDDKAYIGISDLTPCFHVEIDSNKYNKICFHTSIHNRTQVNFTIPSNMKLNHLPKSVFFEKDGISYSATFELRGNVVCFQSFLKIKNRIFGHHEIKNILEVLKLQNQTRNQKIVFKNNHI